MKNKRFMFKVYLTVMHSQGQFWPEKLKKIAFLKRGSFTVLVRVHPWEGMTSYLWVRAVESFDMSHVTWVIFLKLLRSFRWHREQLESFVAPLHIYPAELNINKLSSTVRVFSPENRHFGKNTLRMSRIKSPWYLLPSKILRSFDIFALFAISDRFRLLSEP